MLERSGLVTRSRIAQSRPCRLEPAALNALGSWLGQLRSIHRYNYERLDDVLNTLKAQEEESTPRHRLSSLRLHRLPFGSYGALMLRLSWFGAHTEPEIMKQWKTGPSGHSLPVCEIDLRVGGQGRYVRKRPEFEMGMTAEFKEIGYPISGHRSGIPPARAKCPRAIRLRRIEAGKGCAMPIGPPIARSSMRGFFDWQVARCQ